MLGHRDYLAWLAADTAGTFSASIRIFSIPLVSFLVTGSTATAGFATGVSSLTAAALSLPGGALADRHDRRLLINAYAWSGIAIHGAFAFSLALLPVRGAHTVVYAVLAGARAGLLGNATNVALKSVVPAEGLTSAFGANQARDEIVTLLAGPAAGLLFAWRPWLPFAAESVAGIVVLLCVRLIRTDLRPSSPAAGTGPLWSDAADGFLWAVRQRNLRRLIAVSVPLTITMTGFSSLVVLDLQQRGVPVQTIGLVGSASGAGALIGAVAATALAERLPSGWTMIVGSALMCAAYLPMLASQDPPLILGCMGASALFITVVNAVFGSYVMSIVPDAVLGRALALTSLVGAAAGGTGPAVAGVVLGSAGFTAAAAVLLGLGALAIALLASSHTLRAVPVPSRWEEMTA